MTPPLMPPLAPATRPPTAPADAALASKDAKLRRSAQQLEGAFVQQMYKTMRATVPSDGMFGGGSGEDMFSSLMDQHLAADTPLEWHHGLSEAIYRQLSTALHRQRGDATGAPSSADATSASGTDAAQGAASAGLARTTTE